MCYHTTPPPQKKGKGGGVLVSLHITCMHQCPFLQTQLLGWDCKSRFSLQIQLLSSMYIHKRDMTWKSLFYRFIFKTFVVTFRLHYLSCPTLLHRHTSESIRCVPGRTSLTQRNVLPGTHRFARLMRFSLDTYFNSSPIIHLFDLFVEIL